MFALTFCYEGCDDSRPFALTIAVSHYRHKLVEKMKECIEEDIEIDNDDEWSDSCNFVVVKNYEDKVILRHRNLDGLYICYEIRHVEDL